MRNLTPAELDRVEAAIRLGERSTFLHVMHEPMLVFEVGWAGLRVAQVVELGGCQVTLFATCRIPGSGFVDTTWPRQLADRLALAIPPFDTGSDGRSLDRIRGVIWRLIDRSIPDVDVG